jgi:hypothetical protein
MADTLFAQIPDDLTQVSSRREEGIASDLSRWQVSPPSTVLETPGRQTGSPSLHAKAIAPDPSAASPTGTISQEGRL